ANAPDSAAVAMAFNEGMLQLAGLAESALLEASGSVALQFSRTCNNGGLIDFDLTDLDGDTKPSPGDSLRITYRDCETVDLNAVAAGDLVVNLAQPTTAPAAGETVFSGSIDPTSLTILASPSETVTINSSITFEVRKGRLTESAMVSGNTSLTISSSGVQVTESIQGFEFRKDTSFETARYTLNVQGLIDSELLGGTFEFDDSMSISGFLNTFPEEGRYELIGLNNTRVAVVPNFVTASSSANIEVDTGGNGAFVQVSQPFWDELVEGFLWWYRDSSPSFYQVRTYNANDFYIVMHSPAFDQEARVTTNFRIQFSRPFDPASIPGVLTAIRQFDEPPYSEPVDLDVEIAGAALLLTPREQLRHDSRYYYPSEFFIAEDQFQKTTAVYSETFVTPDTLSAAPVASTQLAIGGAIVDLDGSASIAVNNTIVSYLWTQLTGTTGQFTNADQMNSNFTVPAIVGAELIKLQLEVTNSDGEYDREIVQISAFESEQEVRVISFTGDDTDYISQGLDWLLTSANGDFFTSRNYDNGVGFGHDRTDPSFDRWNLEFAAPGNAQIEIGAYDNATRWPFQAATDPGLSLSGNGRGCNTVAGRFDVLEINYDTNGDVLSAAIDFEQFCEGGSSRAYGSVRVGSSIPIPAP
ncbi:MAG: hypothetical protein WBM76_04120, partial [Woeseiaceae bacterium]